MKTARRNVWGISWYKTTSHRELVPDNFQVQENYRIMMIIILRSWMTGIILAEWVIIVLIQNNDLWCFLIFLESDQFGCRKKSYVNGSRLDPGSCRKFVCFNGHVFTPVMCHEITINVLWWKFFDYKLFLLDCLPSKKVCFYHFTKIV